MVKYKPVKESSLKEYISYLFTPFLNLSGFTDSKLAHKYKKTKSAKNVSSYFNRFISDSRVKQVYRKLEFLSQSAAQELEQQKSQGILSKGLHPLQEKEWYIDYLKPRIEELTSEDSWLVMLNDGRRDKYARFLSKSECLNRFEIFVQNYFFSALPAQKLVEIFLIAYEGEGVERKEKLELLLNCLSHKQASLLIKTLRKTILDSKHWVGYCESLLGHMRNSQIKNVLFLLPYELENYALGKLYPYEILEVVEQLDDVQRKEKIIHKVLENRKDWWSGFSHDEVKHALSVLRSL